MSHGPYSMICNIQILTASSHNILPNIGGATLHSWSEVVWQDKRGRPVKSHGKSEDNIASMGVKCNCLRFLFVDEIEACGLNLISQVEEATRKNAGQLFKRDADNQVRVFGGLNVFLLGDFWQLPPTGQIAIMSNPYNRKVLECAQANFVMSMFWLTNHWAALQTWQENERVLHLNQNKRSGKDVWFSNLLNDCREGKMTDDDYSFLHGFPTLCRTRAICTDNRCQAFEDKMKDQMTDDGSLNGNIYLTVFEEHLQAAAFVADLSRTRHSMLRFALIPPTFH